MDTPVRAAELMAALALATDLGQGQQADWQLHSTLLALALADGLGVDHDTRRDVYDIALLRYIGCTSHAYEVAATFGDDIEARARLLAFDLADTRAMARELVRRAGHDRPLPARIAAVAHALAKSREEAVDGFRASCDVAGRFAERLGYRDSVRAALPLGFERWDGKGMPGVAEGDGIPLAMLVVQCAQDAEVLVRVHGPEAGAALVVARGGTLYAPHVAELFAEPTALLAALDVDDPWTAVLDAEPGHRRELQGSWLDEALLVMADYADLKSPSRAGHSRAVAELATAAAPAVGVRPVDAKRAALVHDLGIVGVPSPVLDRPGPLTTVQREKVELHAYLTRRILQRSGGLSHLAPGADHHERCDGSGYPQGRAGGEVGELARLVAAADVYAALVADRPHRRALAPDAAATELRASVRAGAIDGPCAEAVLAAAGHATRPAGRAWPDGLTDREVEVLRLIARGATLKDVARELGISAKTAGRHVENIYGKAAVSTRGAAALYAMQHRIV